MPIIETPPTKPNTSSAYSYQQVWCFSHQLHTFVDILLIIPFVFRYLAQFQISYFLTFTASRWHFTHEVFFVTLMSSVLYTQVNVLYPSYILTITTEGNKLASQIRFFRSPLFLLVYSQTLLPDPYDYFYSSSGI